MDSDFEVDILGKTSQLSSDAFAQLNAEWILLKMIRDGFHVAANTSQPPTYNEALVHAIELAPRIFASDNRLLTRSNESMNARAFRETARALSISERQEVTPVEAVDREIRQTRNLITLAGDDDTAGLRKRLTDLQVIRSELEEKNVTETQMIVRDTFQARRRDIFPTTNIHPIFSGTGYTEYELPHDRGMRVRCTHPDPPEWSMGGDMIFEHHDLENEKVRIAILQYKIWDGLRISKPPSEAERIENQLKRMSDAFCTADVCMKKLIDSPYRLPYCAAFLRPTDQLQSVDSRHASTGYHIPVCKLDSMWEETGRGGHRIPKEKFVNSTVTSNAFEEMFNGNMLGSDWMTYDEAEELYKKHKILTDTEQINLHIQVIPSTRIA